MTRATVWRITAATLAGCVLAGTPAAAQSVKTVFVVAMENANWTQSDRQFTGSQQQIFRNPAAPFINSLINGTAVVDINGVPTNISLQSAYATHYHNVMSNAAGTGAHIHPSEPNYIWAEAGSNLGVTSDNTPYQSPGGTNQNITNHLATLLTAAGKSWKSYQEDIDLAGSGSSKTSTVLPPDQWSVPLLNLSGTSSAYTNAYNGAHQYDYGVKHNPMAFFTDTNGGNDTTPANPLSSHYAPLQQLAIDLAQNTVADYNWITPNQFNDMHTGLAASFTYNGVTYLNDSTQVGAEKIAQGDNFLQQILPLIMSSPAYQNNGAIILWWDESEPDGTGNTDDFNHAIPEIVLSPLAHGNVGGVPYANTVDLTHSSDLRSMQEIFGVGDSFIGDAATVSDLADLFAPGALWGPFSVTRSGLVRDRRTQHIVQQLTVTNTSTRTLAGPVFLVLDGLSSNATLANAAGVTNTEPFGHPFVMVPGTSGGLAAGASATVVLEFSNPSNALTTYDIRLLRAAVVP
jgi:hypothetical protein